MILGKPYVPIFGCRKRQQRHAAFANLDDISTLPSSSSAMNMAASSESFTNLPNMSIGDFDRFDISMAMDEEKPPLSKKMLQDYTTRDNYQTQQTMHSSKYSNSTQHVRPQHQQQNNMAGHPSQHSTKHFVGSSTRPNHNNSNMMPHPNSKQFLSNTNSRQVLMDKTNTVQNDPRPQASANDKNLSYNRYEGAYGSSRHLHSHQMQHTQPQHTSAQQHFQQKLRESDNSQYLHNANKFHMVASAGSSSIQNRGDNNNNYHNTNNNMQQQNRKTSQR